MMDPHAYSLLKKVINNFINELDRSGVQSEKVVWSLNNEVLVVTFLPIASKGLSLTQQI